MNIERAASRNCHHCGKPFLVPSCALQKRFCSSSHRDQFHSRERAEAIQLIRQQRAANQDHQP